MNTIDIRAAVTFTNVTITLGKNSRIKIDDCLNTTGSTLIVPKGKYFREFCYFFEELQNVPIIQYKCLNGTFSHVIISNPSCENEQNPNVKYSSSDMIFSFEKTCDTFPIWLIAVIASGGLLFLILLVILLVVLVKKCENKVFPYRKAALARFAD